MLDMRGEVSATLKSVIRELAFKSDSDFELTYGPVKTPEKPVEKKPIQKRLRGQI
jgi:hypothetical protein